MDAGTIYVRLLADARGLDRGLSHGERRVGSYATTLKRTGDSMTKYFTIPTLAAAGAAAALNVDFERTMTKVRGLTGASTADMKKYTDSILDMAGAVGKAPKELAEALYFVLSSGFKGAEALDVLRVSAEASAAGLGDTAVIADMATSVVQAYGKENITAAEAVDVLTAAVRVGKAEPEEFAAGIGDVISTAKIMGVEFDKVAASLASMTLAGVKTPEAITALNQVMLSLTKPTKAGAELAEQLGLSYAGLRDQLKNEGVIEVLRTLQEATHGNMEQITKLMPNVRGLKALLALTGVDAKTVDEVFRDVAGSTGDMSKAFKAWAESDASEFDKAMGELQAAGVRAGASVVPALADVASGVADVAEAFSDLSPETQGWIVKVGLAIAAVGPLLSVASRLSTIYTALAAKTSAAAAAQEALNFAQAGSGASKLSPAAQRGAALINKGAAAQLGGTAGKTLLGGTGLAGIGLTTATVATIAAIVAPIAVGSAMTYAAATYKEKAGSPGGQTATTATVGMGGRGKKPDAAGGMSAAVQTQKTKVLEEVIVDLSVRASKSKGSIAEILKGIDALRSEAAKSIDFTIDPKKPLASLQSIQARLMDLGMDAKTAYQVIESVFGKDVAAPLRKHMQTISPAMDKAADQVEARHSAMRTKLLQKIAMPRPDNSGLLAAINQAVDRLQALGYSASQAAAAVQRALNASSGAAHAATLDARRAYGGIDYLNTATRFLAGEGGPEIAAFFPLNNRARTADLYSDLTAMLAPYLGTGSSPSGTGARGTTSSAGGPPIVNLNGPFIGAPPESWAEFVQANAADVVDMALAGYEDAGNAASRVARRGY